MSESLQILNKRYPIGKLSFIPDKSLINDLDGKLIAKLSPKENALLKYLVLNENTLCERGSILISVWGEDDYFLGRSMDVYVTRLRKYLKADGNIILETKHGVGFKLSVKQ